MSDETTRVLKPQQLTEQQFASVQALIVEGGEVRTTHLAEHIKSSHWIAMIVRDGQLACVGAVKAARHDYIRRISRKSGYALYAENCMGEFGYVVTKAAYREQGLARALSAELLKDYDGTLYATTRDDNLGIHNIVRESGFTNLGKKWLSSEHPDSSLMLWLKK